MANQSNVESIEVKASDIRSVVKSYQLPMEREALGKMPIYLKSVNGLTASEKIDELNVRSRLIYSLVRDTSINFIRIGEVLKSIRCDFKFKKSEWKSFELFCKSRFDMSRTSVFNYIKVFELFGERIASDDMYSRFTFTQLVELVPIAGRIEELNISPSTSIEKIKAVKKDDKQKDVEMVAQVAHKESVLSVKNYSFGCMADINSFLSGFSKWPYLGSVDTLGIKFYRVYLSDGRELVAENIADRVNFHFVYTASGYDFIGRSLENVAKVILDYGYSASTEPIEDIDSEDTAVAS